MRAEARLLREGEFGQWLGKTFWRVCINKCTCSKQIDNIFHTFLCLRHTGKFTRYFQYNNVCCLFRWHKWLFLWYPVITSWVRGTLIITQQVRPRSQLLDCCWWGDKDVTLDISMWQLQEEGVVARWVTPAGLFLNPIFDVVSNLDDIVWLWLPLLSWAAASSSPYSRTAQLRPVSVWRQLYPGFMEGGGFTEYLHKYPAD